MWPGQGALAQELLMVTFLGLDQIAFPHHSYSSPPSPSPRGQGGFPANYRWETDSEWPTWELGLVQPRSAYFGV